ncbi:MAG: hypothetical protein OEY61_02510 [Gammaproteobacteria bacterium]|nr:hypothetical protein [Gammaproteobacteria bacterium]
MFKISLSAIYTLIIFLSGCASPNPQNQTASTQQKPVEDIIPFTMANMRGHQALYKEGWYVITSSDKALSYAQQKSVISSRQAISLAASSIAQQNDEFAEALSKHWDLSLQLGKQTFQTGTRITGKMLATSSELAAMQIDYGQSSFKQGWSSFIKGNIHIGQRTQSTRETLLNQPGDYFQHLNNDFSNIYEITSKIQDDYSLHIGASWRNSFGDAANAFNDEYQKSGQSSSAIGGLFHIITGYAKGLYQGLFKPGAKTVANTATVGAKGAAQLVFLPTATAISVSGRTIEAVGTTVFYTGKLGVEIISPTVEAGLLSGMAILSLGTTPLTYVTGASIGAVNQVAFTAAAPLVTATSDVALTAADTGKYVAFISYDAVAGSSKVVINQASSAVVLGYNALTALPAHVFMGAIDSAIFLAYDGPRLVIAYARGNVKSSNDTGTSIDSLPVGSVVDLNALEQEGIEIKILSDDATVIKNVLEKLPSDLRE